MIDTCTPVSFEYAIMSVAKTVARSTKSSYPLRGTTSANSYRKPKL